MRLHKGDTITADMLNEFFLDLYTKINQMTPDQIEVLTTGQFITNKESDELFNRYTNQIHITNTADTLLCELAKDINNLT